MRTSTPLVLVGCGGHASDLLSVIEACNEVRDLYRVVGYVDDDPEADDRRLRGRGVPRIGTPDQAAGLDARFAVGIGYPKARAAVVERLLGALEPAPPLIHPGASLATGVQLAPGAVVFGGVGVGPLAVVGRFALLGRNAVVGHDSIISDYASLMPGCVIGGGVRIGAGTLVGTNATIFEGLLTGEWSQLGAGGVLTHDLPERCTAIGSPARITRRGS